MVKEWLTVHMHHPELGRFAAGEMSVNNNTPSKYTNRAIFVCLCITQTTKIITHLIAIAVSFVTALKLQAHASIHVSINH